MPSSSSMLSFRQDSHHGKSYRKVNTKDEFVVDDSEGGVDVDSKKSAISVVSSQQQINKDTMRRLIEMARPERHLMICSAITMAFGSAVYLAVPTYSGKIIDMSLRNVNDEDHDENEESSSPFHLLFSLLGIMTVAGVSGYFRILWQAQAGHRMVARLRRKLYAGMLSQDAAYFDSMKQGDLVSRLSSDADLVQSAVTDQALGLLRNIVVAIGAVVLLFYTSISLALISVAILPPIAMCARLMGRQMKERQKRVRELHAAATSLAEQALTCIRTVQQFVAESWEAEQYNQAINQAHAEGIQNIQLRALFGSAMQLVVNVSLLCVLGYGGILVQRGDMSPGDLTSFIMYSVMMGTNISGISTQYIDLMKAIAAANRVFEIIDRQPSIPPPTIVEPPENELLVVTAKNKQDKNTWGDETDHTVTMMDSFELTELGGGGGGETPTVIVPKPKIPMSVNFEDVSFSYPTRPESKILNKLTLSIQAGQAVAVVGGSGAGKSTIASLLTRLYDPQSGTISMNGIPIRDMDPQEVRRNIGIVVQEPLLFPTTIEANIRYGTPHATYEQVREAARLAFVLDFADTFADGLQTVVGPRGTQLSGGQKQRVAVARCILKNPPIAIFDEATSALDAMSESHVQKAIATACRGRTVIMIAHRLSTIRNTDAIAVLQDGCVTEMGSFEDLMKKHQSAFRQLMEKQLVMQ